MVIINFRRLPALIAIEKELRQKIISLKPEIERLEKEENVSLDILFDEMLRSSQNVHDTLDLLERSSKQFYELSPKEISKLKPGIRKLVILANKNIEVQSKLRDAKSLLLNYEKQWAKVLRKIDKAIF